MSNPLASIAANASGDLTRVFRLLRRFPAYLDDFLLLLLERDADTVSEEELGLSFQQRKEELQSLMSAEDGTPLTDALLSAMLPILSAETAKAIASRVTVESYLPTCEEAPARTAYFRNAYSDLAYRRFTGMLHDPTVVYLDSLAAVCEEVYSERADLAILPIESHKDGKLSTVRRLIAQYELSPVYFTDVEAGDGSCIRFGLFAASPILPSGRAEGIDLILFADEAERVGSLLTSANRLGAELRELEPIDATNGFRYAWHMVFANGNEDDALTPLRILLQCEYPHHLLCGIFRNLP